ncbi:MAG: adenosylcobinamide-GDP ribazoletransferase [Defluviitaleaceae bacterium]|nr:adenosylcobinamide-GDP ribazoletransferase [Defluviitaleaceae bacterium]
MKLAKSLYMALGMFTAIPLPFHIWEEKLAKLMVTLFPFIGLLIGVIWWGAGVLLTTPDLPIVMVSAVLVVVPFLVAGFIHLDGYMDTSDALLSYRPLEDKLRILKDPTVGAFAVVMLVILFLLQFAAVYTIVDGGRYLALIIAVCVISRSCSTLAIFTLRHMPTSNYTSMLGKDIGSGVVVFTGVVMAVAVGLSFFYAGPVGLMVAGTVVLGYALAMRKAYRAFDGVSGDLLGYALVISELCGLIALALLNRF